MAKSRLIIMMVFFSSLLDIPPSSSIIHIVLTSSSQMSIKGGLYKCAELVDTKNIEDYGLLAEAVAPVGFIWLCIVFISLTLTLS